MLTREEKLVLLIEECSEVIKAATKCLRFGWDRNQPNYGVNHEVLAIEVGDVMGVVDALDLDRYLISAHRLHKMNRAELAKQVFGTAEGV